MPGFGDISEAHSGIAELSRDAGSKAQKLRFQERRDSESSCKPRR